MKIPGPDHPISIEPEAKRVRVRVEAIAIADSTQASVLREKGYSIVRYVPPADIDWTRLTKTARVTHCPYKGDATYYSIVAEGRTVENAAWSYEAPFPSMREIAGHLAFYPEKVTIEIGEAV